MTARPDVLNAAEPVRIGSGGDAITLVEGATFCLSDRWGDILVGRPRPGHHLRQHVQPAHDMPAFTMITTPTPRQR